MPKLTPPQIRELKAAAADSRGIVSRGVNRGFAYVNWVRMMNRMCEAGHFRPYPYGGYAITEAGRAAIPARKAR